MPPLSSPLRADTPAPGDAPRAVLRLMATTDLHAHLRGYDYDADTDRPDRGLTRVATLIRQARAEVAGSLLFDLGDLLQGTALGDHAAETTADPHPMVAALNRLGVHAACPGNHDFNYGLETARRAYGAARFPVVCANALLRRGGRVTEDTPLFRPWAIIERRLTDNRGASRRIRIGVTGALPPQILDWDHHLLTGRLETRGIVESVSGHLPALREAGADVVVVLSHSGLGPDGAARDAEQAAAALAALPGVDAVFAGHSHRRFPAPDHPAIGAPLDPQAGTVNGVPLAMAGAMGSDLGVIDLNLVHTGSGWMVDHHRAELRPVTCDVREDPGLRRWAAPHHRAARDYAGRAVGQIDRRLHTYLARVAPCPALATIAAAKIAAARTALAGGPHADLPVVASAAPFKSGGRAGSELYTDIPAGPVSVRHLSDLYTYPNTLTALVLDGSVLRAWVERAAAGFATIRPGETRQPLLDPVMPGYDFDTLFGLTYTFDLTAPPLYDFATGARLDGPGRVRDMVLGGRPLADDARVVVVTNSYRAGGGGNYPGMPAEETVWESDQTARKLIARHLGATGGAIATEAPWRFAKVPGATAVFETSIKARELTGEIAALGLCDLGETGSGQLRLEIDLDPA